MLPVQLYIRDAEKFSVYLKKKMPTAKKRTCYSTPSSLTHLAGNSRGAVARMLDCDIDVTKFEPELRYYIHFQTDTLGKAINTFILRAVG